eukprot:SAG31_NODE_29420_length_395_cov_1.398649_1_plen_95_part_01
MESAAAQLQLAASRREAEIERCAMRQACRHLRRYLWGWAMASEAAFSRSEVQLAIAHRLRTKRTSKDAFGRFAATVPRHRPRRNSQAFLSERDSD